MVTATVIGSEVLKIGVYLQVENRFVHRQAGQVFIAW